MARVSSAMARGSVVSGRRQTNGDNDNVGCPHSRRCVSGWQVSDRSRDIQRPGDCVGRKASENATARWGILGVDFSPNSTRLVTASRNRMATVRHGNIIGGSNHLFPEPEPSCTPEQSSRTRAFATLELGDRGCRLSWPHVVAVIRSWVL